MSQPIKKVISQVYELEGLLLLIQNHGENTDQFIYDMVREKANAITELVSALSPEIFNNPAEKLAPKVETVKVEVAEMEQESPINLSEFDGVMLGADNSYDLDELEELEVVEDESSVEDDIEVEVIYDEQAEETQEQETDDDIEVEVIYDEQTTEEQTTEEQQVVEEIAAEQEQELEQITEPTANNNTNSCGCMGVESVRKRFSLNDRFRYKRELFANSDVEMNNTLDLVDTMESYAEAEEYFYNTLQWDSESVEVMDFMFIIRNHF